MNRYVAFLDILGFGDLVKEESLAKVKSLVATALSASKDSREKAPMVGFDGKAVKAVRDFSFSDTFVLLSDDDSSEALLSFLSATIYLTRTLYAQSLPVRGAVTFGEADFITDTPHAVGKAIVAAAELEKRQHWFGVAVDDTNFPSDGKRLIANQMFEKVLLRWKIPVKPKPHQTRTIAMMLMRLLRGWNKPPKSERHIEAMVINWRYNLEMEGDIASLCRPSEKSDVQEKLKNTAVFETFLKGQQLHKGDHAVRDAKGNEIYTPWLTPIPVRSTL
jgi:hypothetical protein